MKKRFMCLVFGIALVAASSISARAAAPKYDATGTWDYELSAIWHNCNSFTPPPTTGTYTTVQTGNTFFNSNETGSASGTIDGNRYLRWQTEKSGSGMQTLTKVYYLHNSSYGKGYFAGSWSNASSSCGWGGNITVVKRSDFPCQASDTQLCLNNGRFSVSIDWRDQAGKTGVGHAIPSTDDSGLFWFFSSSNMELLVKVLNGCSINNRYWVFFAATTDQEFTVTVTDTKTGQSEDYTNPLKNPADAVTDTDAFATCP